MKLKPIDLSLPIQTRFTSILMKETRCIVNHPNFPSMDRQVIHLYFMSYMRNIRLIINTKLYKSEL